MGSPKIQEIIDGYTYRILSYEDLQYFINFFDFPNLKRRDIIFGIAINNNNECISISSQNWRLRGSLCDDCTQNCGQGGWVWTREDYRNQGIFKSLFAWVSSKAGIEKIYISKSGEWHRLFANKNGLIYPEKNKEYLLDEFPIETKLVASAAETTPLFAQKITEWLQNGN